MRAIRAMVDDALARLSPQLGAMYASVGLNADDAMRDATVFTKNRDHLREADVAQVVEQARVRGLTSDEHFTVDGAPLEAWAGAKSFQPNGTRKLRRRTVPIMIVAIQR